MDNPIDLSSSDASAKASRLLGSRPPAASKQAGSPLGRFKVWQKLALLGVAFAIPVGILLYEEVSQEFTTITAASRAQGGAEYLSYVGELLSAIPQHRGMSNSLLNGDTSFAERRAQKAAEIDAAFAELATYGEQAAELRVASDFAAMQRAWVDLKGRVLELAPAASFAAHTKIMEEQLIPLIAEVGDSSGLVLSDRLDIYYVADLVTKKLPGLTENLGQLRGLGAGVLARGELTEDQYERLEILMGSVSQGSAEVATAVASAVRADPSLESVLGDLEAAAQPLAAEVIELAEEEIADAEQLTADPTVYFNEVTEAIDTYFALYNASETTIRDLASGELTEGRLDLATNLGFAALGVALAALLGMFIARQITRPINELVGVAESVARGDLSKTAHVASQDEIGTLGNTFNTAIVQLREAAVRNEVELERSRALQGNIGSFLDVAMTIADGDFTKRGQVSEDVLGNVVDAINLMVEEIAYLLKSVQDTAFSVRDGAEEMIQTSGSISERSRLQVSQAQSAREEVRRVTGAMLEMAQNADASAEAARRALKASQQGEAAVQNTLQGMQGIRREVQGISKRIKGLGDRSLEISEIVETISRISRQTNLLALNAAIEAAGAGEAGGRFAIVANEVRKLADDSAQATQRVAALIKTVQSEVQEVVGSVEGGTREVEEGYRVAGEAGDRLREIAQIVTQSAEYAVNISQATQQQVRGVEQVGSAVNSIAGATEASQVQINQGRKTAQRLEELSSELSANLARFRLA